MRKHLLIALFGSMALGGVAQAQRPEPPSDRGPARGEHRRLKEELGLTDAQTAQLRALRSEHHKAAIRRRASLRIARIELSELLGAPTVDEKALGAKIKEISDLDAAALRARVDGRMALRKVLSPEQLEKMKQMRPRMEHRRRHMRPPLPPGGRGPGGERPGDERPGDEDSVSGV